MSIAALTWAFEQWLPANEKVVLLVLADCENGQTHVCNPGQEYIAAHASCSERTVREMLKKLEERKLITRVRRSTPEGRATDSYILHRPGRPLPVPPEEPGNTQPADSAGSPQPADSAGTPTGKSEAPNRQTAAGTEEPELNRKNPPTPHGGDDVISAPPVDEDHRMFDRLWDAYPRKDDRKAALQEWYRLIRTGRASQLELIIAAQQYAEHVRQAKPDPRFIKTLRNWLVAGSYDNPLPEAPKSPYRKLAQEHS